jgi:hypothetical protein
LHFERKFARRRKLAQPICRGEPGDSAADYRNAPDVRIDARWTFSLVID